MKKCLCFISLLFLLTGCNRYMDINTIGIVEVMLFSKSEQIKETISLTIPQKETNQKQILSQEGSSLGNAFLNLQKKEEKKLYFDQTQILLLDQTILQEEIEDLIPFLLTHFKHPNWLTFLCKDCQKIIQQEKQHTFYENLVRKEKKRSGTIGITTFEDFASFYLEPTLIAYLPLLEIQNGTITISSLVAFTNQKKFVSFSQEEAKIFYLLKRKIETLEEQIQIKKKTVSISLNQLKANFIRKGSSIEIKVTGTYHLNDPVEENEKNIKQKITQKLTHQITNFLQKEKEVDLLGITNLFYKQEHSISKAKQMQKQAKYTLQLQIQKEGEQI